MYYKDTKNKLHFLDDDSFAHLLPAGSIAITDQEAEAIRLAAIPVVDPKVAIQSKIDALEKTSMIPRITREFMLVSFAVQAAGQGVDPMTNIAYSKLKALDDQIATLRSQL